jgi:K+-transporting ATPase ATPase C chain
VKDVDLVFVGLTIGFFLIALAYVRACERLQAENPGKPVPIDLVTTSASGLDPHISPAGADFQVPRVVRERGMSEAEVRSLIAAHTEGRQFGFLGEPRVNVMELNLDLDQRSQYHPR